MHTTTPLGETVARSISHRLNERGWGYDQLAQESGIGRSELLNARADAAGLTLDQLDAIAVAFGVEVVELATPQD